MGNTTPLGLAWITGLGYVVLLSTTTTATTFTVDCQLVKQAEPSPFGYVVLWGVNEVNTPV